MKGFEREDQLFSLCGLNCGLCPMKIGGYCPGCGGGAGNQSCAIAKCSLAHNNVKYCSRCGDFPCEKYQGIDDFDSFITHRNRRKDLQRAEEMGIEAYRAEQREKTEILTHLLEYYNDGRRKTLFCVAVNLLELESLQGIVMQLKNEAQGLSLGEKGRAAVHLLQEAAQAQSIELTLRKKKNK